MFGIDGGRDLDFLSGVFDKLLVNFTWWVNRQDASDKNSNSLANSRSGWPGRATDSSSRSWPGSPRRCGVPASFCIFPVKRALSIGSPNQKQRRSGLPCRRQGRTRASVMLRGGNGTS